MYYDDTRCVMLQKAHGQDQDGVCGSSDGQLVQGCE